MESEARARGWFLVLFSAAAVAAVGFVAGFLWRGQAPSRYPLLDEAYLLLDEHYLDTPPDSTTLQRGMIRGMLQEVGDPYTVYVEPAVHELESDNLAGEYGGIGALLTLDSQGRVHLVPVEGGAAARAGVREGETLTAVDGSPVVPGAGLEEVSAALRGPEGSEVVLTLTSGESAARSRDVTIVRETIPVPSVTGYLLPDDPTIGVLAVTSFSERTPDELEAAYTDLLERMAQRFVLDLRGNSGGLLDSGIAVSRFFLEPGIVMIERGRGGDEEIYRATRSGEAAEPPLAVIVDGSTASAAEIVAAALQANGRAPLIGIHTYGKGSVQLIFELSDGSSLHVTTARWLTPSEEQIDGAGLMPDVLVDPAATAGTDPFLLAAAAWLNESGSSGP